MNKLECKIIGFILVVLSITPLFFTKDLGITTTLLIIGSHLIKSGKHDTQEAQKMQEMEL